MTVLIRDRDYVPTIETTYATIAVHVAGYLGPTTVPRPLVPAGGKKSSWLQVTGATLLLPHAPRIFVTRRPVCHCGMLLPSHSGYRTHVGTRAAGPSTHTAAGSLIVDAALHVAIIVRNRRRDWPSRHSPPDSIQNSALVAARRQRALRVNE
jgi:hypothetical protein